MQVIKNKQKNLGDTKG